MIRISTTNPIAPLRPRPQLLLWPRVGNAPGSISELAISLVSLLLLSLPLVVPTEVSTSENLFGQINTGCRRT